MDKGTMIKGINTVYLEVKPLVEKTEAEKQAAMRVAIDKVAAYQAMKADIEKLEALKNAKAATPDELKQLADLKTSLKDAKKEAVDAKAKVQEVQVRLKSAKATVENLKDQLYQIPGYSDYFELVIAKKMERSINHKTEENAKIDERTAMINSMKDLAKNKEADKALRTAINLASKIDATKSEIAIIEQEIRQCESDLAKATAADKPLIQKDLDNCKNDLKTAKEKLADQQSEYSKALSKYSSIADKAGVDMPKEALAGTVAVLMQNGVLRDNKGSIDMNKTLDKTLKADAKIKKSNEKQLMNLMGAYQETPDHISKMAMYGKGGVYRKEQVEGRADAGTSAEPDTGSPAGAGAGTKKLHWYNFFGRFNRWMRKKLALSAPANDARDDGASAPTADNTSVADVEKAQDEFKNLYKVDINQDLITEEFIERQRRAKQALKDSRNAERDDDEDIDR